VGFEGLLQISFNFKNIWQGYFIYLVEPSAKALKKMWVSRTASKFHLISKKIFGVTDILYI